VLNNFSVSKVAKSVDSSKAVISYPTHDHLEHRVIV
jgi:hypothetical protein